MLLQVATPPPSQIPFDPNQLIPLIGIIGGFIVVGVVLYAFFKSDLAAALAERIRSGRRHGRRLGGEWIEGTTGAAALEDGRAALLEERIGQLQGQVAELAERLDFAERMLAQRRERSLPGA